MRGFASIHARLGRCCKSPLLWILCAAAALRAAGILWGLPAADGWDDDGIAPRNFLVGIIQTYTPGSYFTYPPLHMLLLAVITAPGWIIALFKATSLSQHGVIAEITKIPYMTYFSITARLVSAVMSVATIFLIAKMTETIAGRRAGYFAAAMCSMNAALTYYGQVTNLDGPYLFWSALSIWGWMRTISDHDTRHLRWSAVAAAAAIATKDQAYAIFLCSVPLGFFVWFAVDKWPRENARVILSCFVAWSAIAVAALLLTDGAVFNPSGFAHRIAFLAGPASHDYAQYQASLWGRLRLLIDMWKRFPTYYPAIVAVLAGFGVGIHLLTWRDDRSRFMAGILPLFAIVSFTLCFNFVALRSEPRFFLPQSVLIAPYVGIAADGLFNARLSWLKYVACMLGAVVGALALYQCLGIDRAMLADPRYDAERWMQAHVHYGDTIETYGLNAYLPRFPRAALVTRVGRKPLKARNPLPNVTEIVQPFGGVIARQPRFIVVSGFWVRNYLAVEKDDSGRVVQKVWLAAATDRPARQYFQDLFAGRLPYRMVHVARYQPGMWPTPTEYESLAQTVFLFERIPGGHSDRRPGSPATYHPPG